MHAVCLLLCVKLTLLTKVHSLELPVVLIMPPTEIKMGPCQLLLLSNGKAITACVTTIVRPL